MSDPLSRWSPWEAARAARRTRVVLSMITACAAILVLYAIRAAGLF